ncbi:MAG TPA: flavodoxin-dependent (E)-4-hydroxy-3-methylbut-2-enyl-diphosphate synthase [Clostridiales bacterium]|nr:flavodoxin-dependent (E)-4-hydroxy-3-methylbut-2-enyl-diphosphate synthase [Clostridiales bacterium]HOL78799.1 flavodoxin-dependent (E)-4-hydroxy-3-methylbut-2-enyl-diphosphate synthase [Clostridiales bacterium]HQA05137.1 flavodoxin-dependent (E)-4-hydroxy-3-methylbut-2-enyl-diphosphate synthase [Clostridiales bacterium]
MERRKTRQVAAGSVPIGGGAPIAVQSMLNKPAHDIEGNVEQAKTLEKAGCEIIRLSVPDKEAVKTLYAVKQSVSVPVVADIHFDYRLALESAAAGADKIRINPGNIGSDENVAAVARECKTRGIPIRIGVNSGSVEKHILKKHGGPTPEALVESALYHVSLLEKCDFYDIVLSMKSSDVVSTVRAYELASERCGYPLHIGVTEAGTERTGIIKSSAALGALLLEGIGDTIRISLTADPVNEVAAGIALLKSLGLRKQGVNIISCPTCGRTKIDLIKLANEIENRLSNLDKNISVAVMGCVVNGPGEASHADIGIAGGDGCAVIFKGGKVLKKVSEDNIIEELMAEIEKL